MSLLDNGPGYEWVTVYPEVTYEDDDGNTMTRARKHGIPVRARFQPQGQSGTSARRAEMQDEGFFTERVYLVQFTREFDEEYGLLGAQSKVKWRGKMYSFFGDPMVYNGSRRTRHNVYTVRRN